ncbi:hypothetical protein CCY01nite_47750 [Chitinophaga cymbidii]|uniref:Uncharacterized protein n=2 Tax=Chitinophaga cymbidii TaxID=1096750 RepID=A0A512RS42_9BACT|nr:hypothetical protein CCY01nite_47750 [Chitinophaga cymbidii]
MIAALLCNLSILSAQSRQDYKAYHRSIIRAEELIVQKKAAAALDTFSKVFETYNFIFLRDYKVATELALYLGDKKKAFHFLRMGILSGWTLKEIKKEKFLASLRKDREWKDVKRQYDSLHAKYWSKLDLQLRKEIHKMFKDDQYLAFANLFKISRKGKERLLHKKFIPQSERQMAKLRRIIEERGYPGEMIIGNSMWMWTILSHHNSISPAYEQKDTLYLSMKPLLRKAIQEGELSPYDYAVIEDSYVVVRSDHKKAAYGYLNTLSKSEISMSNKLRAYIGMRTVETRNSLIDIEEQTGMDFYLTGSFWEIGKIVPKEKD